MADHLLEHVIVQILERLPTKSLIRFTSVSKRWRFIILSDPHFAMSQFQIASHHRTLRRRLLISTASRPGFKSLDLEAPPPPSQSPLGDICSVRCPLTQQPGGRPIRILCSCNGLILATLQDQENNMYIWNPSTQFFKNLPDPADLPSKPQCLVYYGFGYLSATDDYKIIANLEVILGGEVEGKEMHIFSSKANIWKRAESPLDSDIQYGGTLSNEALHWFDILGILAFDLAKEEFRRFPLPILDGDFRGLRVFGDCLCAFDFENLDLWVMKEYSVADSWTKLFKLKVSNQPEKIFGCWPVWVMETSTFLQKGTLCRGGELVFDLIRSVHTEEKPEMHVLSSDTDFREMIEYQETLLWLAAP
ncbi:F-box protein CPR1-like [Rosa rugosa]|uniref:F-box protein CPR1-like n=1 Tax=Rosa rugosa TaxID=74645 RepID=UPI002B404811|nr:F-box protein CPR1-like [Rosa rugosa]